MHIFRLRSDSRRSYVILNSLRTRWTSPKCRELGEGCPCSQCPLRGHVHPSPFSLLAAYCALSTRPVLNCPPSENWDNRWRHPRKLLRTGNWSPKNTKLWSHFKPLSTLKVKVQKFVCAISCYNTLQSEHYAMYSLSAPEKNLGYSRQF